MQYSFLFTFFPVLDYNLMLHTTKQINEPLDLLNELTCACKYIQPQYPTTIISIINHQPPPQNHHEKLQ